MNIKLFSDENAALRAMTEHITTITSHIQGRYINLALSGGGTAQRMFGLWQQQYADRIDWKRIRFWWVDERCVAPDDPDSNFGYAKSLLFDPLKIPHENIFRIHGEACPSTEAVRYEERVRQTVPTHNDIPVFDTIILGIGDDMHTASIFPYEMELLHSDRLYAVGTHPISGQKRITMTGRLILNASNIVVPVLGQSKSHVIEALKHNSASSAPANYIASKAANFTVFSDSYKQ